MFTRRRTVTALATSLAAVAVAVGSSATFTSASANPSNTFSSGTLTQSNTKLGGAILTATNLKPGDSASGEVTITNTGSLGGSFTLSKTGVAGALMPKLSVVITDTGNNSQVYSGPVADMPATQLGSAYAAGEARTYRFTVTLAQDADDTYQGKDATVEYRWNAVQ